MLGPGPANMALGTRDMTFARRISYKFPQKKNAKDWVLDKKETDKEIVASPSILNDLN